MAGFPFISLCNVSESFALVSKSKRISTAQTHKNYSANADFV